MNMMFKAIFFNLFNNLAGKKSRKRKLICTSFILLDPEFWEGWSLF